MASTKTKQPFDVSEALREAARKRREAAEIDVQKLAAKLASGAELTEPELLRLDAAVKAGVEPDAFDRAVQQLAEIPELTQRVTAFDYDAAARSIRSLEADFARQVAENRQRELEAANTIADLRLRALSAETAKGKLQAIKARYPHANA